VLFAEAARAVEVHLGAVARTELLGRADAGGGLVEEVLEAGRRDDLTWSPLEGPRLGGEGVRAGSGLVSLPGR
jgi:hypothetical protein